MKLTKTRLAANAAIVASAPAVYGALAASAGVEYAARNARATWRHRGNGRAAREAARLAEMEAMRASWKRTMRLSAVLSVVIVALWAVIVYA